MILHGVNYNVFGAGRVPVLCGKLEHSGIAAKVPNVNIRDEALEQEVCVDCGVSSAGDIPDLSAPLAVLPALKNMLTWDS